MTYVTVLPEKENLDLCKDNEIPHHFAVFLENETLVHCALTEQEALDWLRVNIPDACDCEGNPRLQ